MPFCRSDDSLAVVNYGPPIDLGLCFQNGVLLPVMSLLMSVALLNRVRFLSTRPKLPADMLTPHKLLVLLKLIIATGNLALTVVAIVQLAGSDSTTSSSDLFGLIVELLPLLIAPIQHWLEYNKSRRPSTSLSTYYLLQTLFKATNYRTLLRFNSPVATLILAQAIVSGVLFLAEGFSVKLRDTRPGHEIPEGKIESPEYTASYLSKITFTWVVEILIRARRNLLEYEDLWYLPRYLRASPNCQVLESNWQPIAAAYRVQHGDNPPEDAPAPSFLTAIAKTVGPRIIVLWTLRLVLSLLQFLTPSFVSYFVAYLKSQELPSPYPTSDGVAVAIAFLISLIYRKGLRVATFLKETDIGQIVTLMSVDAQNISNAMFTVADLVAAPVSLVLALVLLYNQVGWSMLMSLATIFLSFPLLGAFAKAMMRFRTLALAQTDGRVKVTTEALASIKTLKLYGWTWFIRDRIVKFRELELHYFQKLAYVLSFQIGISFMLPAISTFAVFAVYALTSPANSLNESRVFVTLSIMRMLENPIQTIVWGWNPVVEAFASSKRLGKFLVSADLDSYVERLPIDNKDDSTPAVHIKDAAFTFTGDTTVLTIDDLAIKPGTLTAIVGKVGSGKSALVASMLGEIQKERGSVSLRGRVAFATQQPWIQNATLRENILFGLDYDEAVYDRVIAACAMRKDVATLTKGHDTLIGEKGISLSGGQKARVAAARVLYAAQMNAVDLVLMDDIFSALDSHVDRHMWNALFNPTSGLLRGKTVVLVTHGIHHLDEVDDILLVRDATIAERGTYESLLAIEGGHVRLMVEEYQAKRKEEDDDESASASEEEGSSHGTLTDAALTKSTEIATDSAPTHAAEAPKESKIVVDDAAEDTSDEKKKLVAATNLDDDDNKETKSAGSVNWRVYALYCKYCGYSLMALNFLITAVGTAIGIYTTVWLAQWAAASARGEGGLGYYLGIYAGFTFGNGALNVGGIVFGFAIVAIRGARNTMAGMLDNILRVPMSFFDTTPSGRILNRFTADIKQVDTMIPQLLFQFQFMVCQTFGILITIFLAVPWFFVILLPICVVFGFIQYIYLNASREIQRIYMVLNSPVYQHFSETLSGLPTVRAYQHEKRFLKQAEERFDASSTGFYNMITVNRWLFVSLNLLGTIIMVGVMFTAVLTTTTGVGMSGVALTYSFDITFLLSAIIRVYGQIENAVVSVERIAEYSKIPTEAAEKTNFDLPPAWPSKGEIEFQDYQTTYREGLPPVLKGIDLKIKAGAKVGVVGRTGAGKSSMTLALFRIIEAIAGKIVVDGVDVSTIGLQDLRSRLTILPQDPVIFNASIRDNLDPTGSHDDAALWSALEGAHLAEFVRGLEGGLEHELTGGSLSVGQQQLVCLSRAILRKTKILVLDEATSSIDHATDDIVQETIRREFADCTIVTIAHRIGTILDYDYTLVLDQGKVVEFDTPQVLLTRPESAFYALAKESKLV
ncbi:P-loop containing nucleoside triphosphate hydrolase protein [Catenaria anguillulae PL171]|uniref:p-loop containing nucleoside triphosphate hydrolase protein n=1 Tax=Catenaria anguillulae PL171 TaxID=765915 RepID=A0A1Y2HLK1_9FUNG|nr:P-loop containing nucleoside triphosphate hydrolase protein [Catenaria anguillulae PL171]